jgi:hypothetical protein
MINQLLTFKVQGLYGAYAPDVGVCFYGACFEEAVNGLNDELRTRAATVAKGKGNERSANGRD